MKKSVLLCGVSGTGKSTLCGTLSEMGYKATDLEEIPGLYTMYDTATGEAMLDTVWNNDDPEIVKRMKWMCDLKMLAGILENEEGDIAFYAGSAENITEMMSLFTKVFVLTAPESVIRHRLATRTSNDFGRVEAVQDMVIGWKDWFEENAQDHGAVLVDSERPLEIVATEIITLTKG